MFWKKSGIPSIFLFYLVLQSNEVTSSNAMEKEGLVRGIASLQEKGVEIESLVTDRHASVAKWMRENQPDIKHQYDVWHIAKGNSFIYAFVRFSEKIYRIQLCLSFVIMFGMRSTNYSEHAGVFQNVHEGM